VQPTSPVPEMVAPTVPAFDPQAILAAAQEQITAGVVEALKRQVINDFTWTLKHHVEAIVADYVKEQLGPAVKEQLATAHVELVRGAVEAAVVASAEVGNLLREHLIKKATESFSSSYKIDQLVKGVFG
jgi:hypothetical protein